MFLGEALRQLRDSSRKTLDDAARAAGKDRARLIKVLDGKATLTAAELEALATFLEATPAQRDEIMALGVEARKKPTGSLYTDLVEGSHRRVAWLEAMAKDIWEYEKGIYPHLVQSPTYVRAVLLASRGIWWEGSDEELENRVTYRLERQRQVFEAERPKQVEILFTSDTLDAVVDGPDVMREQSRTWLA
ncbi:hypothetical protein BJF78_27810 [Pseudonocardia sp. CNS-139]|nr:hypothetical protein BJF78_27810 [Pseudonocardia sp. CNS-139]